MNDDLAALESPTLTIGQLAEELNLPSHYLKKWGSLSAGADNNYPLDQETEATIRASYRGSITLGRFLDLHPLIILDQVVNLLDLPAGTDRDYRLSPVELRFLADLEAAGAI